MTTTDIYTTMLLPFGNHGTTKQLTSAPTLSAPAESVQCPLPTRYREGDCHSPSGYSAMALK